MQYNDDRLLCLPCILFPVEPLIGGCRASLLFKIVFRDWKDALPYLRNNKGLEYHKRSHELMRTFEITMHLIVDAGADV